MAAKVSSPMSESRCRSLNKLLPDLEAKLIVDNIKSHLHIDAGGFLNEVEIIEVFSDRSRVEKVRSLFSVLKTKDNAAFGSFCLILSNSGYGHWSKALMEEAGLDHDFKGTPQLEKAKVNAILCKRGKMFKLTFRDICSSFNKCRDQLLSVLEQLPSKDFKMFMISFNDILRGSKKNARFEQSDMESPLSVFTALSLQEMYTQFDLEVFDIMAECLTKDISKKFKDALDNYKDNVLQPLLEKTLSQLTGDAEVVSTHDDQKKQLNLAFVVPDDVTFGTLMKARRYLEEEMEIHDLSNMRFDFNCITVLFNIACPGWDIGELAMRFLSDKHLQEMKKLNITDVFLLSHWAVGVADGSICYFDEMPIPTEIRLSYSAGVKESKNPPTQMTPGPEDDGVCELPGCQKKKYREKDGTLHPFCGRSHGKLAKQNNQSEALATRKRPPISSSPVTPRRSPRVIQGSNSGPALDKTPSDPGLLGVMEHIPNKWTEVAIALGVPTALIGTFKSGLDALAWWRDGQCKEHIPTTWSYLLEKIAAQAGNRVADDVKRSIYSNKD